MKSLFMLLAAVCVVVSAWCGWKAWELSSNAYGATGLLLFACATVASKLGEVPDERMRRKWYVLPPMMTDASGPYDLKTMGVMWRRGQMPPGTQVAEEGKEWRDVAAMVKMLDGAQGGLGVVGGFGAVLMCVGLLVFFFWSWLAGAVLSGLGLLFIITATLLRPR